MSVAASAKRGIAWTLSSNILIQAFQFGIGVVLARLLSPDDFGVFAVTSIFTGLAATVANIGLGSALVQRKEVTDLHCRSMLAMNLLTSAAVVLVLWLASPWIGRYFNNPLAASVLVVSAWNFFINSMSSVSFSMMSRALRFRSIAQVEMVAAVAHGAVATALAIKGFGVWAIAWAGIAQSLVRASILLSISGWRPGLAWNTSALGDLLGFGAGLTLKRIINYMAANVDYFVIGRRLGTADLGYYTRAYSLMTLPLNQLSRVIMQVLFPAFARIQDDNARIIGGYSRIVTATSLVSFPFLTGLALVAPSFVAVIYGEKWLPTVLPLQIMCVAGMMKSVSTFVGAIVEAKAQIGAEIRRQLINLAVLVVGAIIGSRYGTTGVAIAVVIASMNMLVMMQMLLGRMTGMRWITYLAALAPAVAGAAVMSSIVIAWQQVATRWLGPLSPAMLGTSAAIGAVTYVTFFLLIRFPRVDALRTELIRDIQARRSGRPRAAATPPPAT